MLVAVGRIEGVLLAFAGVESVLVLVAVGRIEGVLLAFAGVESVLVLE